MSLVTKHWHLGFWNHHLQTQVNGSNAGKNGGLILNVKCSLDFWNEWMVRPSYSNLRQGVKLIPKAQSQENMCLLEMDGCSNKEVQSRYVGQLWANTISSKQIRSISDLLNGMAGIATCWILCSHLFRAVGLDLAISNWHLGLYINGWR